MQIGVTFPQNEIGADPIVIRDYAQTVEGLGYSHLVAFDHVLGADPTHRPGWQGYTFRHMFRLSSFSPSVRRPSLPSRRPRWMYSLVANCALA